MSSLCGVKPLILLRKEGVKRGLTPLTLAYTPKYLIYNNILQTQAWGRSTAIAASQARRQASLMSLSFLIKSAHYRGCK